MIPPGRHHLAFVLASALAGAASQLVLSGSERSGALVGLTAGLVSGFISLAWVVNALQRSMKDGLVAVLGGFLIRLLLVPVAMLSARALGGDVLACVVGFFVLYAVGQALEILQVRARSTAQERRA